MSDAAAALFDSLDEIGRKAISFPIAPDQRMIFSRLEHISAEFNQGFPISGGLSESCGLDSMEGSMPKPCSVDRATVFLRR